MSNDFTISLRVAQSPMEVYNAINNVRGWWGAGIEGNSQQLNDIFEYRHKDFHYSKQKLVELVPGKRIVWLMEEGILTFVNHQEEWKGTKVIFDISEKNGETELVFTHQGLTRKLECYGDCSAGWTYYIRESLLPLIQTGKGNPDAEEIAETSTLVRK